MLLLFPFSLAFAADVVIVLLLQILISFSRRIKMYTKIRTIATANSDIICSVFSYCVQLCLFRSSNSSCCYFTVYIAGPPVSIFFYAPHTHTQIHIAYLYTYGHKKNKVHSFFYSGCRKLFSFLYIFFYFYFCVYDRQKGGGVYKRFYVRFSHTQTFSSRTQTAPFHLMLSLPWNTEYFSSPTFSAFASEIFKSFSLCFVYFFFVLLAIRWRMKLFPFFHSHSDVRISFLAHLISLFMLWGIFFLGSFFFCFCVIFLDYRRISTWKQNRAR